MSEQNVEVLRDAYEWVRAKGTFPAHLARPTSSGTPPTFRAGQVSRFTRVWRGRKIFLGVGLGVGFLGAVSRGAVRRG
jgi:hypothetical protein